MATALSNCNAALLKLGSEPVTSIVAPVDDTKRAKLCAAHYDRLKLEFLSAEPVWRFAIKYETLTGVAATDPNIGYSHQFVLPVDYIKTYLVGQDDTVDYARFGNLLYANDSSLELFYVADVDEAEFPVYATKALTWEIAREFSYSLVQSNETKVRIENDYNTAMSDARMDNFREKFRDDLPLDEFTGARR